jgi:gamma-glutamylcyclotransferase (GGCT)/AIG2-like uncharacterized protein YtfP/cation transport regulator ChaC
MKVFVYGSLRRHEKYHHFLEDSIRLYEQAWIKGELFDTKKGYPALHNGDNLVYGEIYEISSETLKKLDDLEGYQEGREVNLFVRKEQEVNTDTGTVKALVYYGVNQALFQETIPSGDWKVHQFIKNHPENVLYFAYGSCMDQERFQLAGVDQFFQRNLGAGHLKGYTMKYNFVVHDGGRGDIVEDGGEMEGVVYNVPKEAVDYLFKREGVVPGWYRAAFVDVKIGEALHKDVLTFIVIGKKAETCPPLHYAREILRGSLPYVSGKYHKKLKEQLMFLGVSEDQIVEMLEE